MDSLDLIVDRGRDCLTLPRYPFPTNGTRRLGREDIAEIVDWFPPAILTKNGEFLFVSRTHLTTLQSFCAATGIPITNRFDIWSALLDPFLDTEFSDDIERATTAQIEAYGLSGTEIEAIRASVERPMIRHTARSWEWQHYGLYDVLSVMKPKLPFRRRKWRRFYDRAMEIARLTARDDGA